SSVANSVPGPSLVNFASTSINWTKGTIKVIDPPAVNSTTMYAFNYSGSLALNMPATDTLMLGDGTSVDAGGSNGNPGGFILNPGGTKFYFGTVVCNGGSGGTTGTNRYVSISSR